MSSVVRPRPAPEATVQMRPAHPDEGEMLAALAWQQVGTGLPGAHAVMATFRHDPRFVPEHLRVVEVDGERSGMLLLIDRLLRYGIATVRCAILLPFVGETMEPAAAMLVTRDMVRWAAAHGFHLALRWAPNDPSVDQGFAPGQKTYATVLPARARPLGPMGYTVRAATAADAPALAACYHAATAAAILAERRSDEPWQWRPADEQQRIEVVVDPLGDVRGYARVVQGSHPLHVPEVALVDDGPAPALFDRLLQLAAGGEVRVTATPDNRWSRWVFAHGASWVIGPGEGHGAVRLLDLPAFLHAVRPELERRLQASEFAVKIGRLRLETPLGSVGLVAGNGRLAFEDNRDVPLVALPWGALGSLVTGYRGADSLAGQPGVRVEGARALRLLQVLFPEGYPYWSPPACF